MITTRLTSQNRKKHNHGPSATCFHCGHSVATSVLMASPPIHVWMPTSRRPRWPAAKPLHLLPAPRMTPAPVSETEYRSELRDASSAASAPARCSCPQTPWPAPASSPCRPGSGWPPACRSGCSPTSRSTRPRSCRCPRCAAPPEPAPGQGCRANSRRRAPVPWTTGWQPWRKVSVCCRAARRLRRQLRVRLRPAVAEELPRLPHLGDHVQVQIRRHQLVFIEAGLGHNLAPRIAEVALPIKFPDAPRLLFAHPVDGAYEIAVGHRVCRLLQLP